MNSYNIHVLNLMEASQFRYLKILSSLMRNKRVLNRVKKEHKVKFKEWQPKYKCHKD